MRILFDATPLQTGHRQRGVGAYTRELLRALLTLDRDNEYRLIVHPGAQRDTLPIWPLPPNAQTLLLPRPALGRLTALATHQLGLPALLARQQADLFHSPGFVAAMSVPGLPWRCFHPLALTVHDFIPLHVPALFNDKAGNRWWYRQQMRLARRAALLICVSEATRQDALRCLGVAPEHCLVVHEGVNRQVFYPLPAEQPRPEPPFVLFVGGDFPNKNRPAALAAFNRLTQATDLPHRLVLVGDDKQSEAELARRHPGLDLARVQRLAGLSQEALARLYREASALLFPSTCEGFGLPVLEAMASGAPVVTSTASSLPEVAGEAALLVDPHDAAALADALHRVLTDASLRQTLRNAGLARAASLSWEATARQTLAAYRRLAQPI